MVSLFTRADAQEIAIKKTSLRRRTAITKTTGAKSKTRGTCCTPLCCCCLLPLLLLLLLLAALVARDGPEETKRNIQRYGDLFAKERYKNAPILLGYYATAAKENVYSSAVYVGSTTSHYTSAAYNALPDFRSWWWAALALLPTRRAVVTGGISSEELEALRARVNVLEADVATLRGQRWATVDHTHDNYITKEHLQSLLSVDRARIDALEVQLAKVKATLDTQAAADAMKQSDYGQTMEQLSQIVAALGERVKTLEHEAKVMSDAVYAQGSEQQQLSAKLTAAVDAFGAKSDSGIDANLLAQLARLPALLSRMDAIDTEITAQIRTQIATVEEAAAARASSNVDGKIAAAIAGAAIGAGAASDSADVSQLRSDLREQQDAFVDLRQQVVSLAAALDALSRTHEETKSSYASQMSSLELQMTDFSSARSSGSDASLDEVRRLIALALAKYDADKTGMVDYALESAGGQIVSTRCSKTYAPRTRKESIWGIPLWYSNYSPRTVIQRKSQAVIPGECWSFEGSTGYLLIALSGYVRVTHITYEHIPLTLAPDGNLDSAPQHMQIWGYQSEHDPNATMIAEFNYNARNGDTLQTFEVDSSKPAARVAYPMIELRVLSNHGHPKYTCLYRLRVHGKRVYPQYGQERRP